MAMLRWTKISPGFDAVTTLSGTRESAQPIHRTCDAKKERGGWSAGALPARRMADSEQRGTGWGGTDERRVACAGRA